jgi:hypothetical protein
VTGERFIPFRKTSIVEMCADDMPAEERESFRAFAELLASLLHHEFRSRLEALKDTYHPLNPDSDTHARSASRVPRSVRWLSSGWSTS